jgi:serine/threonine protein kinase
MMDIHELPLPAASAPVHKGGNKMTPASLEGQTLGKYRVLEPLGRGGMARVYRAYHPQLDRYVAIKVLRSDLVEEEEFLARFRREAQAVAALRHTNVVQVFDFDVQDNVYYIVMELLEGDTLKTRLNDYRVRGEHTELGEMVRILLDVLDGLAYAHSEGMTHRDVKPANILLTKRGQAVVADFGIAQIIGGTRHTVSGALMGTLNYMAPEQGFEGRSDARSDIYSLGIVLYEALTGRTPFDADTPLAILMKHLNDPLPLPRQIDPAIPEPFERVVLKALAKRPEERYQSAEEMAQALHRAAEEAGTELPAHISLPLSFTTAEAPSEPVAVFSGPVREKIQEAQFAADDTDETLGQHLAAEGAEGKRARGGAGMPILGAILLVIIGNLCMLTVAKLTGHWQIFEQGWPIEIFFVSWGLCVIMYTTFSVWMLIPIGSTLGTGILLTYCSLTGNWDHWSFLWLFEVWIVIISVVVAIGLARRKRLARGLSRPLALLFSLVSIAGVIGVALSVGLGSVVMP